MATPLMALARQMPIVKKLVATNAVNSAITGCAFEARMQLARRLTEAEQRNLMTAGLRHFRPGNATQVRAWVKQCTFVEVRENYNRQTGEALNRLLLNSTILCNQHLLHPLDASELSAIAQSVRPSLPSARGSR
jgi:hypothetical protein